MNQINCLHPTDLQNQLKNCMKCELLKTCSLVDYSKGPAMPYKLLGKISSSNNTDYVGCFLEVSEINYNRIKEAMNKVLKDNDFEKHLNDFTYHLIEEVIKPDIVTIKDGQEHIINSNVITHKTFTVYVFYTIDTKFQFELMYDSKYPTQLPINLYIKEILKNDYNG